jgi:hypothetical protein
VTVELLGDRLKFSTFGTGPVDLVPIAADRFRVEGTATYLQFRMEKGKVKEVVFERPRRPKVTLMPGK